MKALQKFLAVALAAALPAVALAEDAPAPSVKVTPYGFVQISAYFNANTFGTKDYPAAVSAAQSGGSFLMSARYSRFGVKLAVDDATNWTNAKLGGGLEFDFKAGHVGTGTSGTGAPTAPSTSWYNGLVRLRLAFVTADWKTDYGSWQVLAGQHYGLVNGVFATSITHTADPIFWQAGNVWRRAPEVRLTYNAGKEMLGLNVAAAMLSPQTADGTSPDFGSGNASRMPSLEARLGIDTKFDMVSLNAGVAYSVGKRRLADAGNAGQTVDVDGNIIGVDAQIGTQYLDLKGEWFQQEGLGDTYNTIAPGAGAPANTTQVAGKGTGFWAQAIAKPVPQLSITLGYGTEKVDNAAAIALAGTSRKENTQLSGGVIVNAGKFWKFGVEATQTTTKYQNDVKQDGMQVAVSSQLAF